MYLIEIYKMRRNWSAKTSAKMRAIIKLIRLDRWKLIGATLKISMHNLPVPIYLPQDILVRQSANFVTTSSC